MRQIYRPKMQHLKICLKLGSCELKIDYEKMLFKYESVTHTLRVPYQFNDSERFSSFGRMHIFCMKLTTHLMVFFCENVIIVIFLCYSRNFITDQEVHQHTFILVIIIYVRGDFHTKYFKN